MAQVPRLAQSQAPSRTAPEPVRDAGLSIRAPADPDPVVIDCDHCTMRGTGCGDCVVTVLLGGPPYGVQLNEEEQRAIDVLADAGLVPPLRMVQAVETQHIDPA